MEIALVGDAFVDVQVGGVQGLPVWGADRACSSVRLLPGGSCANTARHLASLCGGRRKTVLVCAMGDDTLGKFYSEALAKEPQLSLRLVTLPDAASSSCVILSGADDRAMLSCYSSNERLHAAAVVEALRVGLDTPQAVHLGGYFSCAGLQSQEQLAWIEALRAIGVKLITCDPQHDSSEKWRGKDNHLLRLLEKIDIFLPNEMEAMGVSGAGSPQEALNLLTNRYPNLLVVVKIGAGGVMAGRGKQEWAVRGYDDIECVDTTGAGDAFNAGFLDYLLASNGELSDQVIEASLKAGCAAGALCVMSEGACETPLTHDQLTERLGRPRSPVKKS